MELKECFTTPFSQHVEAVCSTVHTQHTPPSPPPHTHSAVVAHCDTDQVNTTDHPLIHAITCLGVAGPLLLPPLLQCVSAP